MQDEQGPCAVGIQHGVGFRGRADIKAAVQFSGNPAAVDASRDLRSVTVLRRDPVPILRMLVVEEELPFVPW